MINVMKGWDYGLMVVGMNKEIKEILDNFDNAINELPKTNNIASSLNSINVGDLREAVKRLKHIPNYDELLKENKKLKLIIDKAIEYIKNTCCIQPNEKCNIDLRYDEVDNLLNILRGEDK